MDEKTFTYQTRLEVDEKAAIVLDEYAHLLSKVEHSLYVEISKGKAAASCKSDFLKRFGITARQFNACRVSLEGKISSCRAGQQLALVNLKQQIKIVDKKIEYLTQKPSKSFILHQKKRRRIKLFHRLSKLEKDLEENRTSLCFGGKKLF